MLERVFFFKSRLQVGAYSSAFYLSILLDNASCEKYHLNYRAFLEMRILHVKY